MDKTPEIANGYGSGAGLFGYSNRQSKPKNSPKLRAGEIVKGVIVATYEGGLAEVRLPNGTFTAEIKGRLKAGDSLFFYVKSVTPSLFLTIHSVSYSIAGKDLDIKDIIRILDLPESQASFEIVDFLKTKNSTVIRQDCISIYSILSKLEKTAFNYRSLREFILAAYDIIAGGFEESAITVGLIAPVYSNLYNLKRLLKDLKKYTVASEFISSLNSFSTNKIGSFLFCSEEKVKNTNTLSSILKFIPNKEIYDLNMCVKAQRFRNESGFTNASNLVLIYPVSTGDDFILCRLELLKNLSDIGYMGDFDSKLHQTFKSIDKAFESLGDLKLPENDTEAQEILKNYANKLNMALIKEKIALVSFFAKLSEDKPEQDYFTPDRPISAMRLSVVV